MCSIVKACFFSLALFVPLFLPGLTTGSEQEQPKLGERKTGLILEKLKRERLNHLGVEIPVYNGNRAFMRQEQEQLILSVCDDFKVNDDIVGAGQTYPGIAVDGSGNFVITWMDNRNSSWDIYAQRYSLSGNPQGSNFRVDDDAGSTYQGYPAIAIDGSGNFIITWMDDRNGGRHIYAQRYNSSGTPQGSNFKVNDDVGTAEEWYPDIASDDLGGFVITWEDYRNGNTDIYAQRYGSAGSPQGANFKVNDDAGTVSHWLPAVALDDAGNFVIIWQDERNGGSNPDIYAQRYNSSGTPQGSNFKVNDDAGTAVQYRPALAVDGTGNFVITWEDLRNGDYDLYSQRYSFLGTPQGCNFKVNDDTSIAYQSYPAIAMNGSGDYVITWYDERNGTPDIYSQRYNFSGAPQGSNFKVDDDVGTADQYFPATAMDGSGSFVIAWFDYRNANPNIYAQRYNSSGTSQGTDFQVNDDLGTAPQYSPAVAVDGSGCFVISWVDDRNANPDIYAQRYKSSGSPWGANYLVTSPLYAAYNQYEPSVSLKGSSVYFTWMDRRSGNWDIYAKVVDWTWPYSCGDGNADGSVTVSDVVYLINYLFKGGPAPLCPPAPYLTCGDANGNGKLTISDVVYLINYLFKVGPTPAC